MTYEEIASLGSLVNINITEAESKGLIPNMESVLGYIDQIQKVDVSFEANTNSGENPVLREDISTESGEFAEAFMQGVPEKQDGYVKVPQVLDK